jgi:A/G-specific adenine glycosylase
MTAFSADLLAWYDAHKRDLPWRGPRVSAYHTWLSEIMLQQTRVDTVIPYFHRFIERFPRVDDLAAAPLDAVLSLWSGLGYYSRARNLHRAAQLVVERGGFPQDLAGLKSLPGVGDYVSAAVGSIAFGVVEPAIDGNLERVLARCAAHPGGRKAVLALGRERIDPARPGDFNQAMMDLGSQICIVRDGPWGAPPTSPAPKPGGWCPSARGWPRPSGETAGCCWPVARPRASLVASTSCPAPCWRRGRSPKRSLRG